MTVAEGIVLGLVQGLTEFMPVSSSGHLVLAEAILGVSSPGLTLEIFLHLGTLVAILAVFRADVIAIVKGALAGAARLPRDGFRAVYRDDKGFRLFCLLMVGSLPAAAAGFTLNEYIGTVFKSPLIVSLMLLATGCIVFSARFARGDRIDNGLGRSLLVGVAQATALVPGISRSGATIVAGLHLGLSPEEAGRFSFLLALPAIFGASLLEFGSVLSGGSDIASWPLAAGTAAALVSGCAAIKLVMKLLAGRHFADFAFYVWIVGLAGLIVGLVG